jgi:branched-chain amino acid transport system ATP-binding protein
MSGRLYCFQEGRVSLRGASSGITRAEITRAYFGL